MDCPKLYATVQNWPKWGSGEFSSFDRFLWFLCSAVDFWMTCNWTDSGFSRWHLAPAPVTSFIQTKVWSIQSKKLHHHVTSNISKCWLLLSLPSLLVGCGGGGSKETLLLLEPEIFHSCREYSCFKMSFALVMKSILSFADRKIGSNIPSLSLNF